MYRHGIGSENIPCPKWLSQITNDVHNNSSYENGVYIIVKPLPI